MSSVAANIADALKTDIEAQGSWPVTLSVFREYLIELEREDLGKTKRLSIFPINHGVERTSRGSTGRTHSIGVILRSVADPTTNASVDVLIETCEAIGDRYAVQAITYDTDKKATVESVEPLLRDQLYDVDRLAGALVFQGGWIINYNTRN